jgi:hypothetical protein
MGCWMIEFADNGQKMIIGEELYKKEVERNWAGRPLLYEAHWFDINECHRRNRGIPHFGIYNTQEQLCPMPLIQNNTKPISKGHGISRRMISHEAENNHKAIARTYRGAKGTAA